MLFIKAWFSLWIRMFPIYIEPLNLTFPTSKDSFQCPFFVSNLLFMFSIYFSCYQSTFCVSNLITMFPMFFSCFQSTYYRKSLLCISPSKLKIIPVKIIYDGLGCLMEFNNMWKPARQIYCIFICAHCNTKISSPKTLYRQALVLG